jgi:hypothetical protein
MYETLRFYRQIGTPLMVPAETVVLDAATAAWVAAVVGDGGTVSAGRRLLVDALILGLKADGVFSKLDRLWLFAAENSQSALRDIIATAAATATSSPLFQADRGYTGDSGGFVNTNFVPHTAGGLYSQDSASLGYWSSVRGAATQPRHGWLAAGNATGAWMSLIDQSNGSIAEINAITNIENLTDAALDSEFALINRSGSGASELYVDGASVDTATSTSQDITGSVAIYFCGRNANGTLNQASDEQIAAGVIGGSLDATDASNLYSRLGTYMAAVGVPPP